MQDNPPPPIEYQVFDPESGDIRVVVVKPPKRRYWLHILLFLATVVSTLCVGARLQYDFIHNISPFAEDSYFLPWTWALQDWHRLALGIPFSMCLLCILTAHELGHYVFCVRRKVYATWPYFIPVPTMIGTLGAFIRIRSPIRNRRDLFDIGIAGPIAGFIVAIPVLFFSLLACKPLTPDTADANIFGFPLIFKLAHVVLASLGSHAAAAQMDASQLYLHPTAVAAWVGMFATALNLIPGGQLDGGHIVFGIHPPAHRIVSTTAILALLPLAWYFWTGWLLWAVVLRLTGQHPQVPSWPDLDLKRKLIALFGVLMLVLTFSYSPLRKSGMADFFSETFKATKVHPHPQSGWSAGSSGHRQRPPFSSGPS
jgi:Peptidase family M50